MRHRLFVPTFLGAALTVAAPAAAQGPDFEKVQVRTEKVGEGVWALMSGAGGNIGVSAGADGVFLVDDEWAPLTPKVKAAVAAISNRPLRFILNTHWHPDHTGGNENLGEAGVLIVAHDNVRRRMSADQFIEAFGMKVPPSPEKALPVVTFDNAVALHVNGDDIQAFHVPPAHTDGDAIVQFRRADVIHMGDLFLAGMYPFVDLTSGGSFEGVIAAADRALALAGEKTRIIPGHGPLATRADLRAYRDMMVTVRERLKPLVQAGKTAAEISAAKPTADLDAKWGAGFLKPDQFVDIVARSLATEAKTRR
jgi:glyoxylase-like metal-dependent hydrolase (beta-lactamase superfamily II)